MVLKSLKIANVGTVLSEAVQLSGFKKSENCQCWHSGSTIIAVVMIVVAVVMIVVAGVIIVLVAAVGLALVC